MCSQFSHSCLINFGCKVIHDILQLMQPRRLAPAWLVPRRSQEETGQVNKESNDALCSTKSLWLQTWKHGIVMWQLDPSCWIQYWCLVTKDFTADRCALKHLLQDPFHSAIPTHTITLAPWDLSHLTISWRFTGLQYLSVCLFGSPPNLKMINVSCSWLNGEYLLKWRVEIHLHYYYRSTFMAV